MPTVRITSRFLITIPKEIRRKLDLKPGQRLFVSEKDGAATYTPIPEDPIAYLCGIARDEPSMTRALLEERARDLENE